MCRAHSARLRLRGAGPFGVPREPVAALASLDLLSGGRLVVTVGGGFPGRSCQALSEAPWAQRFDRLDETISL